MFRREGKKNFFEDCWYNLSILFNQFDLAVSCSDLVEMAVNNIRVVEADLTRHKLVTTENGDIVRIERHIMVFDNIDKYMAKCHERKFCGQISSVVFNNFII